MKLYKNTANDAGIVIEIHYFLTSLNLLAFHEDIT